MIANLMRGAAAGAAGTTAINAVTYLDMALRARSASTTPQRAVEEIARRSGHPVPGDGEQRANRLQGLGPLAGIATGLAVGALAGLAAPAFIRMPVGLATALLGSAAMAGSDGPLTALGLTDPRAWSVADWLADALPHLAYGAVTVIALRLSTPSRVQHR